MDEKLRFVARHLEGEKMAPLCREFGISRVTGYKIVNRYKECGLAALVTYDTTCPTARSIGHENLTKPHIQAEIQRNSGYLLEDAFYAVQDALGAMNGKDQPDHRTRLQAAQTVFKVATEMGPEPAEEQSDVTAGLDLSGLPEEVLRIFANEGRFPTEGELRALFGSESQDEVCGGS